MKNLNTRQVENLKRRLGQKRVSRWTENPKGWSRQKLGIKAYAYAPLDRLYLALLPTSSSNGVDRFNQLLLTARDEILEHIWAIAELKLDEIIYTQLYVLIYFVLL